MADVVGVRCVATPAPLNLIDASDEDAEVNSPGTPGGI